jgi:hypothetical protein
VAAPHIDARSLPPPARSNYSEFIVISKEIATLESEMLELKGVLEEWRTVPELLESGTGDDDFMLGCKLFWLESRGQCALV